MSIRTLTPALFLIAACGSPAKTPEPAKPVPLVWKDMNADQRKTYMTDVVMPKAKAIFVAFDAKRYEAMDCKTCHGDGVDDGSFEMPNPKIKPLPNTAEAFMAWVGKEPEVGRFAQFMSGQVEPLMGELLQTTVFDPKTKTGELNCSFCHTLVDADGKNVTPPRKHH